MLVGAGAGAGSAAGVAEGGGCCCWLATVAAGSPSSFPSHEHPRDSAEAAELLWRALAVSVLITARVTLETTSEEQCADT